jgi:hypothetical protein
MLVHGLNVGHGFTKYVVLNEDGSEPCSLVFPSAIAHAAPELAGAIDNAVVTEHRGQHFWTGEDVEIGSPLTDLSVGRLEDSRFIPVLVRSALRRASLNGAAPGVCVTGLPANQAEDTTKAQALGARLREGSNTFTEIRVIAEPLGLLYSALLDSTGAVVGDEALASGRVGVVDMGHLTIDTSEVLGKRPVSGSLDTWDIGTSEPLGAVRSRLSNFSGRNLTLQEADQAIREKALKIRGKRVALPGGWDTPLLQHGETVAARLVERWKNGAHLDTILIGGGGAELPQLTDAILRKFPHATVVAEPQMAVARGYAALAQRIAKAGK